jgi:hypothetical protein
MFMCDPIMGGFDEEVNGNRFNNIPSAGTEGQLDNNGQQISKKVLYL